MVSLFDGVEAGRDLEGVVGGDVGVVVGELVVAGEVERLVRSEFVEAGEASVGEQRGAVVLEGFGNGGEELLLSGLCVDVEMRLSLRVY